MNDARRLLVLLLRAQLSAEDERTILAADRAARRKLLKLPLPPRINKADLAERVLNRGVLHQHEREFIAGWLKGKPRHRPPSADTALKADEIAEFVFYFKAIHPEALRKEIDAALKALYGVSPRTITNALNKIEPERERSLTASAANLVAQLDEAASGKEVPQLLAALNARTHALK